MTADAQVRKATLDDLDELVALWAHYIRVNKENPAYRLSRDNALKQRRKLFEQHVRGQDSCVFVIPARDGGIDGMLSCFVEQNTGYFDPARFGRFQTPFVRPEARGRGAIRRLLAAAYLWARDKGLSEIRLFTSAYESAANLRAEEMGFEAFEIVRRRPVERIYPPGKTPFDEKRP
ncbi:MAG: GNAT family N-acetyltransferase [Gemmatimonadales bacterium]|nr:MAG: GNAT family N-acetyltransferase [Gemmatimonadales bacterium]